MTPDNAMLSSIWGDILAIPTPQDLKSPHISCGEAQSRFVWANFEVDINILLGSQLPFW